MPDVINLQQKKNRRKHKKIVQDLEAMLKIITLAQKGLSLYKEYVPAQELISVLETNKTFLEIYKKKYENEIKEA